MKKKLLLTSILSIVMCFSLICGATFALFTSESKVNIAVTSGTVKVTATVKDDYSLGSTLSSNLPQTQITDKGNGEYALTNIVAGDYATFNIEIKNESDVDVLYQITTSLEGNLAQYLDVSITKGTESLALGRYTEWYKATPDMKDLGTYTVSVSLDKDNTAANGIDGAKSANITLVVNAVQGNADVPEIWNGGTNTTFRTIKILDQNNQEVEAYAVDTAEQLAGLAALVNGTATATVDSGASTFAVSYEEDLNTTLTKVNKGDYFALTGDIDLAGIDWQPIGANGDKAGFQGIFDGQGYTISNLTVKQTERAYQSAGLFGSARYATIKNLKIINATIENLDDAGNSSNGAAVVVGAAQFPTTISNVDIENATVIGNRRVGTIAGYFAGTIEDCDVKDVTLKAIYDDLGNGSYDNADKVGGIVAYFNTNTESTNILKNNTVTNATIEGYRDVGGIVGYNAYVNVMQDNKIEGLTLILNGEHNYKKYATVDECDVDTIFGEGTSYESNVATNVDYKYIVSDSALFADVMALDIEVIDVTLTADVSIDIGAWTSEYYVGGASTKEININANGNGLNFNHKNSDWNYLRANNDNVIISIDNATLTNSGANNGPWNRHDIRFYNQVKLTNVKSYVALAFLNNADLTDVYVEDARANDDYLIWITAQGQTVNIDGLTLVDAKETNTTRGIKIADQYVDEVKAVNLNIKNATFDTSAKAAILVTSTAGANITLENIDISNVLADTVNAVWVDEDRADYANKVTVTGGSVIVES